MNREQRRAQQRALPKYAKLPADKRLELLYKNGITNKDLQKSYNEGYQYGAEWCMRTCYAAVCLMLRDLFGSSTDQVVPALRRMDELITTTIDCDDRIREVQEQFGFKIDFTQALPDDRILETGAESTEAR